MSRPPADATDGERVDGEPVGCERAGFSAARAGALRALWVLLAVAGTLVSVAGEVRLGPWLVPRLGPLPCLGLAALALAVARPRARRWPGALWGGAVLLVALAVPRGIAPDPPQAPRLPARLARPSAPGEAHAIAFASLAELRDGAAIRALAGRRQDLDVQLAGFLLAPESGTYTFEISCGDACSIAIDGRPVLGAAGRASVALAAGLHELRVGYAQREGRSVLGLLWDRPAWLEAVPIAEAVTARPDPGALAGLRARERRVWLRHLASAAWWAAASTWWLVLAGALAPGRRRLLTAIATRGRALLRHPQLWPCLATFAFTVALLAALQALFRPQAREGVYFHAWTSEYMMQALSLADLRLEPLRSLWYDHIQPPAFDAIRAALVARHPDLDAEALMRAVDRDLYRVWAVAAGLLTSLACLWLGQIGGVRFGLLGGALLTLHPATIFYATFLDSTLLSALGVSWLYYELWRFARGEPSAARLAASALLLFFTRSIVQWPFLVVLGVSLWLLGAGWRRGLAVIAPAGTILCLFLLKQYALFGITFTSSFGPYNFCNGLAAYCQGSTVVPLPELPEPGSASALRRTQKLNGEYNYNQLAWLRRSFSQMAEYRVLLRSQPLPKTLGQFADNAKLWLRPSSRHSAHVIVDGLPWRGLYERLFSSWSLLVLLGAAAASALQRAGPRGLRRGVGLLLPGAYVAAVSILFESGENMRYKFFLEPVLFVMIASQAAVWGRLAFARLSGSAHGSGAHA